MLLPDHQPRILFLKCPAAIVHVEQPIHEIFCSHLHGIIFVDRTYSQNYIRNYFTLELFYGYTPEFSTLQKRTPGSKKDKSSLMPCFNFFFFYFALNSIYMIDFCFNSNVYILLAKYLIIFSCLIFFKGGSKAAQDGPSLYEIAFSF